MNRLAYSLILFATVFGFGARWLALDAVSLAPLDYDAVGYLDLAQRMTLDTFYSGTFGEREPLHMALLALWFQAIEPSPHALRSYTVMLSTILILACSLFLWKLSGKAWFGIGAAWIMALHPGLIEESVRGLRLESLTLLLLASLSAWLWLRGWMGAVVLGVTLGATALLQAPALSLVLPLVWIRRLHWRWYHLLISSCLAVALFAPHLYGLYTVHGDASWPSYQYARWNANVEFPERYGTEGFPTDEEAKHSLFAGPRLSYSQYIFELHSVEVLIRGQIVGWMESTAYMTASLAPKMGLRDMKGYVESVKAKGLPATVRDMPSATVVIALTVGFVTLYGWLALLRHAQWWWIPCLTLWGTWYVAYLYSVKAVEPFRHTGHVYPLLVLCFLYGLDRIGRTVYIDLLPPKE